MSLWPALWRVDRYGDLAHCSSLALDNSLISRHITADAGARPSPRHSVVTIGDELSTAGFGSKSVDVPMSGTEESEEAEVLAPARLVDAEEYQIIAEPFFG